MRVISQNGCDYPYESIVLSVCDGIIYARPVSDIGKQCWVAKYSTQEKAEKAMQMLHEAYAGAPFIIENIEVPDDFAEKLKALRNGIITIIDREDNVRIEPMNIVFRLPQEDEI